MAIPHRTILTHPGVRSLTSAGLVVRSLMSMVGISTILAVKEFCGSYAAAGLVDATNFVAMAIGIPTLARCTDRCGQSRVMLPAVLVSPLGLVGLVVATAVHTHLGILIVLSTLADGLTSSIGLLIRTRWTAMPTRPEEVHTVFSLEVALGEVTFILGPVLVTTPCTTPFLLIVSGWVHCVAMQLIGELWFLGQRATEPASHPTRPWRTVEIAEQSDRATTHPPVMRYGAIVSIAIVLPILRTLFGASDVAVVVFTAEAGHKSTSSLVLAVWGVGFFGTALLYNSRTWGRPLRKQLMAGLVGLAVGTPTFGFAPSLVVPSVLAFLTGLTITPTLTSGNNIVQVVVAPSQLTRGLAWASTTLNIGVSIGSLLTGQATDAGGSRAGHLVVAVFAWGAVVVGILGLPVLRRAQTSSSLGGH